MIIRKIRMVNFRGFRDKTIDFQDKPVVLLSAANGMGKTTTVDAIEWCLTGDIGRLRTAFDTRSTNDADRKMNTDGILKNRDAGVREKVWVKLWLLDGETESILCREQTKDELNPRNSIVTLNHNEESAQAFIREYVGDSFYNFHFCDVQKSFNLQSKKRKDLEAFFGDFITNYDRQKRIADNLDIFAEDVERYIEDKRKQKISQAMIEEYERQLKTAQEAAKQIAYPKIIFYAQEKIGVFSLSADELTAQKQALTSCGYQLAKEGLAKLVANEALKNQQSVIKEIASYWNTKEEAIRRAVEVGFLKNTDSITSLEKKLKTLEELPLSKKTIFRDGESVLRLEVTGFTQSDFDADQQVIQKKNKKVQALSAEIDLLTKNNKMLKLLSDLSANKKVVIEHRDKEFRNNGAVRCPICGSESFATMEEDLILKEADAYIRQNGEVVNAKQIEVVSLNTEIEALYQKIIDRVKSAVDKEREKLCTEISDLKRIREEAQPYFDAVRKLQMLRKTIDAETLTPEKTKELLTAIEGALLEESKEQEVREGYQRILMVLGYKFENETVQQTYEKVKSLITTFYEVSNFSFDAFVSKLNSIDSILANQNLRSLQQTLETYYKKNEKLDTEISGLRKLKDAASQRANNIRSIVETLCKNEYKKVGPTLSKFYNKLARLYSSNGIRIIQGNEGISLLDDRDKNIVNVLSNGQISVFMLAHFFAGINVRNNREKMKVFFIDDLTACMDDVNMLAFMDLLKYQISSKATMNQLFFITCDDRIGKLLKYKLSGRGVELCELLEGDFV